MRGDWRSMMDSTEVKAQFGVELKPCPFCGHRGIGLWLGPMPHVHCTYCEADGPAMSKANYPDIQERIHRALLAWNFRKPIEAEQPSVSISVTPWIDPRRHIEWQPRHWSMGGIWYDVAIRLDPDTRLGDMIILRGVHAPL